MGAWLNPARHRGVVQDWMKCCGIVVLDLARCNLLRGVDERLGDPELIVVGRPAQQETTRGACHLKL